MGTWVKIGEVKDVVMPLVVVISPAAAAKVILLVGGCWLLR